MSVVALELKPQEPRYTAQIGNVSSGVPQVAIARISIVSWVGFD
jgi:hypothetical protein